MNTSFFLKNPEMSKTHHTHVNIPFDFAHPSPQCSHEHFHPVSPGRNRGPSTKPVPWCSAFGRRAGRRVGRRFGRSGEAIDLCRHNFGHHVVQSILEHGDDAPLGWVLGGSFGAGGGLDRGVGVVHFIQSSKQSKAN